MKTIKENIQNKQDRHPVTGTQTLLRGLALLECVADGISDVKGIAARLGTPRSTTHRMLTSLVAEGYLHHVPYKGYLLGPMLIQLGMRAMEQRPLVALARPHLEALAQHTGDTVYLGVIEGTEVFCLDKVSGSRGLEMRSSVGMRIPLASSGLGKALMLGQPRKCWRILYDSACALIGQTTKRPTLLPWLEFEQRLADYQKQDWCFDLEENEIGIRSVGAPVRDVRNQVVAAIGVVSAVPYMPEDRIAELGPVVCATANAISRELGWKQS